MAPAPLDDTARNNINAIKATTQHDEVSHNAADTPPYSRHSPNRNGAVACNSRDRAEINPVRAPYPTGPNTANGNVPLAIVNTPLPIPCNTTKTAAAGPPTNAAETQLDASPNSRAIGTARTAGM